MSALLMHDPYLRRLPHIMPPGETLFITFRLYGTVPYDVLRQLQEEHQQRIQQQVEGIGLVEVVRKRLEGRYFISFDAYLDGCTNGANWLSNDQIAQLVWSIVFTLVITPSTTYTPSA